MSNDNNVKSLKPHLESVDGGGHNGGNGRLRAIEERLARIEEKFDAELKHLASKKDVADVKTLISEKESSMTKWQIGILSGALIAVVLAVFRTFMD